MDYTDVRTQRRLMEQRRPYERSSKHGQLDDRTPTTGAPGAQATLLTLHERRDCHWPMWPSETPARDLDAEALPYCGHPVENPEDGGPPYCQFHLAVMFPARARLTD